jgi:hypothetical protein
MAKNKKGKKERKKEKKKERGNREILFERAFFNPCMFQKKRRISSWERMPDT